MFMCHFIVYKNVCNSMTYARHISGLIPVLSGRPNITTRTLV